MTDYQSFGHVRRLTCALLWREFGLDLDNAFRVSGPVPSGPVLLVDDMVDSGWTFTLLAILLREAGSGPVLPFALATAKPRTVS